MKTGDEQCIGQVVIGKGGEKYLVSDDYAIEEKRN